ncbi:MAG: aldo/keto reductase [Eubacteriaceae bacterium]|nr:aldo/keto reductase [Eubacteriaceae bacterium]
MKYRDFHGKSISQLGFGAMRLPTSGQGFGAPIDMAKTEELFIHALENGVNYWDTAYVYHNGKSEEAIGSILSANGYRKEINIATKFPTMPQFEASSFEDIFNEQLKRLRTGYIDFYLIHSLEASRWESVKGRGIIEFLDSLKSQGLIHHAGFSFHDNYDAFVKILGDYDWDFCQVQMNFLDVENQATMKGIEYAYKKGLKVAIMEPLRGGQIIGVKGPDVDKIKEDTGYSEKTAAKACFDFLWDRPEILTVLSGMNRMEDLAENIANASIAEVGGLGEIEKSFLSRLKELIEERQAIKCTLCEYCLEGCPAEIDIPRAFRAYNDAKAFDSPRMGAGQLRRFNPNITNCQDCGACEEVCPQQLPVRELINEVIEFFQL